MYKFITPLLLSLSLLMLSCVNYKKTINVPVYNNGEVIKYDTINMELKKPNQNLGEKHN